MLRTTDLTSNRKFKIRNFQEDKIATLNVHRGLRYEGKSDKGYIFSGNFHLLNPQGELIESFEISIYIKKNYPNTFPVVVLLDDKIEKNQNNHMNENGEICFDHNYITNFIAMNGLRFYDFVNYYLPKYFSWVLLKKYSDGKTLQEWAHGDDGTKQFYETLLGTNEKNVISLFIEKYCNSGKINRNGMCYCGSEKKIKRCHLEASNYLNGTPKKAVLNDLKLFK